MQHTGSPDCGPGAEVKWGWSPEGPMKPVENWKMVRAADGAESSPGESPRLGELEGSALNGARRVPLSTGAESLLALPHSFTQGQGRDGCVVLNSLDTFLLRAQSRPTHCLPRPRERWDQPAHCRDLGESQASTPLAHPRPSPPHTGRSSPAPSSSSSPQCQRTACRCLPSSGLPAGAPGSGHPSRCSWGEWSRRE